MARVSRGRFRVVQRHNYDRIGAPVDAARAARRDDPATRCASAALMKTSAVFTKPRTDCTRHYDMMRRRPRRDVVGNRSRSPCKVPQFRRSSSQECAEARDYPAAAPRGAQGALPVVGSEHACQARALSNLSGGEPRISLHGVAQRRDRLQTEFECDRLDGRKARWEFTPLSWTVSRSPFQALGWPRRSARRRVDSKALTEPVIALGWRLPRQRSVIPPGESR
jgi:hypothetical protein